MHFPISTIFSTALFVLATKATPVSSSTTCTAATSTATPVAPKLTYLFTASLRLGKPLNPIAIQGGQQYIEPILNGTLSGPYVNGTIIPGFATQQVYENGKLFYPNIVVAGTTDDGEAFLVRETGVGSATDEYAQLQIMIGGKYAYLQEVFVVTNIRPDFAQAMGHIDAFCVACDLS